MTNQGPRRHRRRLPGMHSVRPCTRTVETQPSPTHPPVEPNPQVGVSHYRGEAAGPDAPARKPDARDHSTRWSNGPRRQAGQHPQGVSAARPNTTTIHHRAQATLSGSTVHPERWVGAPSAVGPRVTSQGRGRPRVRPGFRVHARCCPRCCGPGRSSRCRRSRAGRPGTRSATPPRRRRSRQPTSATTRPHLHMARDS